MLDIRFKDLSFLTGVLERGSLGEKDLRSILINNVHGIAGRVSGLLRFLTDIKVIVKKCDQYHLVASEAGSSAEMLIHKVLSADSFRVAFENAPGAVSFQKYAQEAIHLNSTLIPHNFLWLIFFLEDLGFCSRAGGPFYRVSKAWSEEFLASLVKIKSSASADPVSPEDLRIIQDRNAEQGLAAERFVLKYERRRLKGHVFLNEIDHVALKDVSLGFDILSLNSISDLTFSRKIEVKSWTHTKRFFLSRNEYVAAKKYGQNYFLYLVDMNKIYEPGYAPEIHADPALLMESGDWCFSVEPESWRVFM